MQKNNLTLREACIEDLDLYYEWVNDPEVRKQSFSQEMIQKDDHEKWFKNILEDTETKMFVFLVGGETAGQVRFQKKNIGVQIGFSIAKKFRGQGLGKRILQMGMDRCKLDAFWNLPFVGLVKKENEASHQSFLKVGFSECRDSKYTQYFQVPAGDTMYICNCEEL